MQAIRKLQDFKEEFDKKLFAFLEQKQKEAEKIDSSYSFLIKEIKRLAQAGGKRLRPAFVFYGHKAVGGRKHQDVWPACLAAELIHLFCLIHDDIMDCSELRRGRLTTWRLLGVNEAILIGDLAFALAEEVMSKLDNRRLKSTNTKAAWHYFNLLKFEVIGGQYLDIASSTPPRCAKTLLGCGGFKETDVIKIMDLKSGRYTIARPLQIGAAIAGADEKFLDVFFEYGFNLGIAFQIQDDILGMFGNEKEIGKPADSDLKEGKKTLLAVELRERILGSASRRTKILRKFERIFGNKNLTKKDWQWTRQLMVQFQVLDYCQSEARQLINKAKSALGDIKLEKESKEFLIGVADYILERKS